MRALMAAALMLAATPALAEPKIGKAAPEFELTLVDGSKVKLSELRGQVVMLNFWATWCVPCRQELPLLDRFHRLRKDSGLRVFAITTEDSVPLHQLKKLFAAMSLSSVKRIKGGSYEPIGGAVPSNYVIDRKGVVRYAKAGALELDDLNRELIPLLREPAS